MYKQDGKWFSHDKYCFVKPIKDTNQFNVDSAILKMDCEGCEYDSILDSPKEVLQKFDFIFIEYHYGYINLKEKLEQCGFEVSISPPTFFNNTNAKIPKTYLGDMYAKKI